LLPPELVPSYPSPAADGRDWKYSGSASPSASVKDCPISELPLSSASGEPFAWNGISSWPMPVTTSV